MLCQFCIGAHWERKDLVTIIGKFDENRNCSECGRAGAATVFCTPLGIKDVIVIEAGSHKFLFTTKLPNEVLFVGAKFKHDGDLLEIRVVESDRIYVKNLSDKPLALIPPQWIKAFERISKRLTDAIK